MVPSQHSNCQADVDEFLLTLGNLDEAAHPPAQPPKPSAQEDLPQEALELLSVSVSSGMPSKTLSVSDVNVVAYICGYIVRKRRDRLCSSCQKKLISRIDANHPSHLFLSLKAYSDAKEGLLAPSHELQELVEDLERAYRSVYSNILHMDCVRARLVRRLMYAVKSGSVTCSGNDCDPLQLIVGLFVNIRLHHSLKESTEGLVSKKVRRNRKQLKFSHC